MKNICGYSAHYLTHDAVSVWKEENKVALGNRIKVLRKSHGMSQKVFAEKFSVDQTAVSNWEQGKNSIDVTVADKIADYFRVPVEYVYGKPYRITRPKTGWDASEIEDYGKAATPELKEYLEFKFGRGVIEGSKTTISSETAPSEHEIKVALFGGEQEVTDEMWEEVKRFVEFIKQKKDK